jgi:hypothetical protein
VVWFAASGALLPSILSESRANLCGGMEAGTHTSPEASQTIGRDSVAGDCCFGPCNCGVAPGGGDADVMRVGDAGMLGGDEDEPETTPCGCIEIGAHILPEVSQTSGRDAAANDCCLRPCNCGVVAGDDDAAATDAEPAEVGGPADGTEAAAGAGLFSCLPATTQTLPEESQIIALVTAELPAVGSAGFAAGRWLGGPDDCAIATGPHSRTKPMATKPRIRLKLSILLSSPLPRPYSKSPEPAVNYPVWLLQQLL